MRYVEVSAQPPYDEVFQSVWFLQGQSTHAAIQPVVPDGNCELVVHLEEPFERLKNDGLTERQESILVAGQLTQPLYLVPSGSFQVIGVRLKPLGAYALLGLPLDQITNQALSLHTVDRPLANLLISLVHRGGTPEERARFIMSSLVRRIRQPPCASFGGVLTTMLRNPAISVLDLANMTGRSVRTLERQFVRQVGVGPKMYLAITRFHRAFAGMDAHTFGSLGDVALKAGYYDQAHFIREFRRFAGDTPTRFFRMDPMLAQTFAGEAAGR